MNRYRITGPRGEGPFVAEGESDLDAIRSLTTAGRLPGYGTEKPRGPSGTVVAYERSGQPGVMAKVGAFNIAWLPPAAYEDYPLTVSAEN